jgi:para-aminobenzoate synthetase
METTMFDLTDASSQIREAIQYISQKNSPPVMVALDGGSGSGKTTLAALLEQQMDCVIVQLDDFFAADIPDWEWDSKSVLERAGDVFDWQRVRSEALEPLLAGQTAKWHPFDFEAGLRSDGTYGMSTKWVEKQPAPVIVLEGAYSSSLQLADLVDLNVLVDVPLRERHRRLDEREGDKSFLQRWHLLWDAVEEYYFTEVMPKSAFDLIVNAS